MLSTTPNRTARLAAFAAGVALVGGAAAVAGAVADPSPPFQDCVRVAAARAGAEEAMGGGHGEPMAAVIPGSDGRRAALAGLRLQPLTRTLPAGGTTTWRFRVARCDGEPARDFEREQGKLLHLIVVRDDLTGYRHLHPTLGRDGTWSVAIAGAAPGRYRAFADFVSGGAKRVLGTTLTVPGRAARAPLPAPGLRARTDGYDVELQRPAVLEAGEDAQLTVRVTRDGRPVRDLQPYLGSYGHLVALHAPDLAYSHVHPTSEDRDNGVITFDADLHAAGPYRLFVQFKTAGRVHRAGFTQEVSR